MRMKFLIFFNLFSIHVFLHAETLEEGLGRHISETISNPTRERVMSLADEIRRNVQHSSMLSPEAIRLTEKARGTLCAIPGHSRFFMEEIERMREEGKDTCDARYQYYAETLPLLPSPETISVLGELLYDMRDKPTSMGSVSTLGESAWLSFMALKKMGIRGLPLLDRSPIFGATPGPGEKWTHEQHLASEMEAIKKSEAGAERDLNAFRQWWEEVKSGKRMLSFKGQAVEYRFKPDGTWETLAMSNPPDDGPGRPDAGESRPERRPGTTAAHMNQPDRTIKSSPWLLAASALLLGAAFWWLMRKTHGADRRNQ